jgi:hypothetical protein
MDLLMSIWLFLLGSIIGIILGVILSYRSAVTPLQQKMDYITAQKEDYREIMKYYPYNPDNFRFIGSPVDGIQFEEDSILFVRFKKGNTPCTKEQEHIRTLLENGNIDWFEFMTK